MCLGLGGRRGLPGAGNRLGKSQWERDTERQRQGETPRDKDRESTGVLKERRKGSRVFSDRQAQRRDKERGRACGSQRRAAPGKAAFPGRQAALNGAPQGYRW